MTARHSLDQIVRGLDGVTAGPWREDTHLGCIVGHKGEIISGAVNGAHIIATQPDAMREIAAYVSELEARATAAEATVTALADLLELFTRHYEPSWMDKWADDAESSTFSRHTFGDLRRARTALDTIRRTTP